MKTIPLIAVCLTVLSTAATAQVPGPVLVNNSKVTFIAQSVFEPVVAVDPSAEFVPLSNEAFFSGGKQALEKHLSNLDLYPQQARESQIEGTVRVQFRVLPSGHLSEIRVVESRGPLLDQAAIQTVARMPRWYPAHRSGVAVSSLVVLPITFSLD